MSYDEFDAWEEAAHAAMFEGFIEDPGARDHFYEVLYDEIVEDFTGSRLRSFLEKEPNVATPALEALGEARGFHNTHNTAAFIFAAIAAEVGLQSLLFKPVVYGLVHAESAASLITKLALANRDEGFTKILLRLLAAHGGVDILNHSRSASTKSIWQEFLLVRTKRNRIVHQAEAASAEEAEIAISVASCIIDELFPLMVKKLGLFLHGHTVRDVPEEVFSASLSPFSNPSRAE